MRKFIGNAKQQKKVEITDIKGLLSEKVSIVNGVNSGYGVAYQLKQYAGIDMDIPLNCTIEHGAYLVRMVCQAEVKHHTSHILVFSPFREEVVSELTDITPIAIGPYIAYADSYYPEEYIERIKKKMGKVLLVMPSHSTSAVNVSYNIKQFIQQIENEKKKFDTVMVCIHWEDLKKGFWRPYKEKGYTVVSAGNIYSSSFLNRMKYMFCLSDAVIVNAVTTGMAYALSMNVPVKIINQKMHYNLTHYNNILELEGENYNTKLYELFGNYTFSITEEQIQLGNYIFGLKDVKTKEEMRRILQPLLRKLDGDI